MKTRRSTTLALGLALGLTGGLLGSSLADSIPSPSFAPVQLRLDSGSFAQLAETVKPAVVNVNTEGRRVGRSSLAPFFGDDSPEPMPRRGLGSGVIIDPSGVALTNAHVVGDADEVDITLLDGTKYRATVVGVDRKTGKIRWKIPLPGPTWASPVVVDNVLIEGDCTGVLHAWDVSKEGVRPPELWSLKIDSGCIESTPAVWRNWIWVGTRGGAMFGISEQAPAKKPRNRRARAENA